MSNKIKKFFSKKKEEAKIKLGVGLSGQGRRLNAPAEPSTSNTRKGDVYVPPKRKELSNEAKAAAEAALSRVQNNNPKEFNISLVAIKAQVKRELEAERKLKEELQKTASNESKQVAENKNLACHGVFFRCPLVSDEVLPKKEWKAKIKEFLYEQLEDEKALTACLIIQNCNIKDKADACIETLRKYLENIINNPYEEKYHKIRMENRVFCDKVRHCEGALEFLYAAGFKETEIDNDKFLVWSPENIQNNDIDLAVLNDALSNAEPLTLELDRNIQVLLPSQARRLELPPDFFRISPEEIKREQELRTQTLENAQILKTKAMREKEETRILNRYRFALIRVKFADGVHLQGTFNVFEKLSDIYEFVQSCLHNEDLEFMLVIPAGSKLTKEDMDKSLYDLRLVPNTLLIFVSDHHSNDEPYLKEELLMLIQPM